MRAHSILSLHDFEEQSYMPLDPPRLIVFSGPPCSGKSTLARSVAATLSLDHLEMDDIRLRLIPHSQQSKEDRNIGYRAMHLIAEVLVRHQIGVILSATFGPREHRRELATIAQVMHCPIFLVQCAVAPEIAVQRFRARPAGHPALDLT